MGIKLKTSGRAASVCSLSLNHLSRLLFRTLLPEIKYSCAMAMRFSLKEKWINCIPHLVHVTFMHNTVHWLKPSLENIWIILNISLWHKLILIKPVNSCIISIHTWLSLHLLSYFYISELYCHTRLLLEANNLFLNRKFQVSDVLLNSFLWFI